MYDFAGQTGAWVVTDGTFKEIGNAHRLHKFVYDQSVPLMAVMKWNEFQSNGDIENMGFDIQFSDTKMVDINHTHFVCVD